MQSQIVIGDEDEPRPVRQKAPPRLLDTQSIPQVIPESEISGINGEYPNFEYSPMHRAPRITYQMKAPVISSSIDTRPPKFARIDQFNSPLQLNSLQPIPNFQPDNIRPISNYDLLSDRKSFAQTLPARNIKLDTSGFSDLKTMREGVQRDSMILQSRMNQSIPNDPFDFRIRNTPES